MDYYVYTAYNSVFEPLEYSREPPGPMDTSYDYCYLPDEDAKLLSNLYVVDSMFGISKLYSKK